MRCVVNLLVENKLQFEKFSHGESYSGSSAEIANKWETKKLGFHLEVLDPGKFSCPYHFHHEEEELFLIMKGKAMVRQDDEFFEVKEGDLILFKTGVAHQFYNHTSDPLTFLALSEKAANEVCEYPDSNKKWERASKKLTQYGTEVSDYWIGEENPKSKWPKDF